ncbi:hypothetical protein INT47_000537 [Mucor saturninus]|uniref:Attractin/MKLN-like beta-propeller domain-containing protein n=1 Tax=Mucor saturninus TaxID=64648 RepID=A0A8H7V3I4_9FUNG|nr:hypothetical protein INT47_000537 [Mucor saturninus]
MITPGDAFDPEPRRIPTAISLPDGKTFLIQGGENMLYKKFANKTIAFDTSTNKWLKKQPYTEGDSGTRQIYDSTAVILPNNMVGFYGGLEQSANTSVILKTPTGATMNYDSKNGSYIGFSSIKMYSPTSNTWADLSPQLNVPLDFYPNTQSATINPGSGKIYYFGGLFYTPANDGVAAKIPLSWGYTFNTVSSSWTNETFGGSVPSERIYHTTNLLPNSQDIILYGGTESGDKASTDYCFTLNLSNNEWTKHANVNVPSNLHGPRFTHSAVLVDSTLFVLFGRGIDGTFSPSLITIDVSDATNIAYKSSYSLSNSTLNNATNNPTSNTTSNITENNPNEGEKDKNAKSLDNSSRGLSSGATGGISAGCAILLGVILFIFYRRRQNKIKKRQTIDSQNDNRHHLQELLHVDWDKIDNQYKELPTTAPSPESPQVASINSKNTKIANISTTIESPSTVQKHYTTQLLGNSTGRSSGHHPNSSVDINIDIRVKHSVAAENAIVKPDVN